MSSLQDAHDDLDLHEDDNVDKYDEVVPLVPNDSGNGSGNGNSNSKSSSFQIEGAEKRNSGNVNGTSTAKRLLQQSRFRYVMIAVIVLLMFILYRNNSKNATGSSGNDPGNGSRHSKNEKNSKQKDTKQPKMTLQSLRTLQQQFSAAQEQFNDLLKVQYGKYFNDIFYFTTGTGSNKTTRSRGSVLFESGDPTSTVSRLRLQRKISMKLLEASAFDYSTGNRAGSKSNSNKPSSPASNTTTRTSAKDVHFVWATGGHSATAGHGNFYNESYSAYIQYTLENIFNSVNINFMTRRYAMGGTASGPEIALCTKEIYGIDYDLLVWDYGMTDGSDYWKQAMYNYRANLPPYSNPIHLTYHAGSRASGKHRYELVQTMENIGLGILISNEDVMSTADKAIPDTFGLNDEEIDALPDYVRNYRCGNEIEHGDPYCQRDKYHVAECGDRRFMVGWHPGWKWHALMGYLASYYLIDALNDALQDLATKLLTIDAATIYNDLQLEADNDYDTFRSAPIPKEIIDVLPEDGVDEFNTTHFMNGPNYCHTSKLPAEIRFLGLLTETTTQIGFTDYDKGIGTEELLWDGHVTNTSSNVMQLSYSESQRLPYCPITTIVDFKDYFFIGAATGWQQLTLPNHAERRHYNNNNNDESLSSSSSPLLYGYVVLCMALCDWGVCPNGVLERKAFVEQRYIQIRINMVNVTEMISIQNKECDILRHSNGYRFPVNEIDNTVTIEVQVNVPDTEPAKSYTQISSWIVW